MALLQVNNLEVYYGVICALKGISFEVNEGEIVTLIGANGAGKTTTMQSVVGLIPKRAGSVIFDGKDITGFPPHKIAAMGIARTFQNLRVFSAMTVEDNVITGNH
ncbi:MAG: ATP-binding cassette domain-containing protein, partial [Clostridia bacterium]|nr:ATP-binding cassette domain-containing protein [Clostridia bacterium]